MKAGRRALLLGLATSVFSVVALAQAPTIKEAPQSIKTYPFSDPNPIPVLGINKKVAPFYPYFTFDGYTDKAQNKLWNVVTLENRYVTVTVLPEVGGKVMGAVEKATGNEFVYLNHVMKFRAIGIRGPWTSGGIEHNFGLDLGHAPWAAAAVDYRLITNPDGSVSCVVGGLDLASRSEWRVNIRLPKDQASFETESLWYNPTPLHHAHLSWENAAFKATNDLQFYFPGTVHIGHDGQVAPWPIDKEGRNLSLYKDNNFGDSKSYHVAGSYRNWFGGYWHDHNFGFGHWAPYSDAPGKKLWIWSLARDGAIWEKLLTDEDGQYIEAQSGVKLNQAAERSGYHSPFTQLSLRPLYAETKVEHWFPVKNTGGIADASPAGALNVVRKGDSIRISISPNQALKDSLLVTLDDKIVYALLLQLEPMQPFFHGLVLQSAGKHLRVQVGNEKLLYDSDPAQDAVNRPFVANSADSQYKGAQRYFRMAEDQNAMRNYDAALGLYQQALHLEPSYVDALSRVAEYYYRSGVFEDGLSYARKALAYNSYDAGANYIYGHLLQQLGRFTEAEEAFSMAVLQIEYRSGAYVALSGINTRKGQFVLAAGNARRALDYNRNNLLAYQLLATAYRKMNDRAAADSVLRLLLAVDPLSHSARFEQYMLEPSATKASAFKVGIINELAHETYLELAVTYYNEGLTEEASRVLLQAPDYPMVFYWLAYLAKDSDPAASAKYLDKAGVMSTRLVFPFRLEELKVLEWARARQPGWKNAYYLGLVYWNNLRMDKAKALFDACANVPDYAPFYLTRGALFETDSTKRASVLKDYQRAAAIEPGEWRTWHAQSSFLLQQGQFEAGYSLAKVAYRRFGQNPVIAIDYARLSLNTNRYAECLKVLRQVLVLPQEGAQEGHELYELANLSLALQLIDKKQFAQATRFIEDARKWPENLGSGSPYEPDNRVQDALAAYCALQLGNPDKAKQYVDSIEQFSLFPGNWSNPRRQANNYISAVVLTSRGRKEALARLVSDWKRGQDSLRNWNISSGSDAPEYQWVIARFDKQTKQADEIARQVLSDKMITHFRIASKAIELVYPD